MVEEDSIRLENDMVVINNVNELREALSDFAVQEGFDTY